MSKIDDADEGRILKILLVDDDPIYHRIVEAALDGTNVSVESASNGEAALLATATNSYELILMDIEMEPIGGFDAARQIRSQGTQFCPIVAFTNLAPPGGNDYFKTAGMDGYVSKPTGATDLVNAIRSFTKAEIRLERDPDPKMRLAALIGPDEAEAMMARFFDRLETAVDGVGGSDGIVKLAHDIGGLAGILGFSGLSKAWLTLEQDEDADRAVIREMSMAVLRKNGRPESRSGDRE